MTEIDKPATRDSLREKVKELWSSYYMDNPNKAMDMAVRITGEDVWVWSLLKIEELNSFYSELTSINSRNP